MERTIGQWNVAAGAEVVGSDGDKVGEVIAVQPYYIVVEKGFFFPTDYYIPTSAIADYDGDRVYLSVTKDEALNQGWDALPQEEAGYASTTTATAPADTGMVATEYETDTVATGDRYAATQRTTTEFEGDTLRVPVHEEELSAITREREVGEVEITKDVVAEEVVLEVPVTEERVRVERRVVDRDTAADETAFAEGRIEVPLHAEEVELQKQVRVPEEVEIAKEDIQRTEQVTDTVRREEVRVEGIDIDADIDGAGLGNSGRAHADHVRR